MKRLIGSAIGSYTFDASAKTITLSNVGILTLEQILLITNTTTGQQIYIFNSSPLLTISSVSSVTTLNLTNMNLSGMTNTDSLQIWIDIPQTVLPLGTTVMDPSGHVAATVEYDGGLNVGGIDIHQLVVLQTDTNRLLFKLLSLISNEYGVQLELDALSETYNND